LKKLIISAKIYAVNNAAKVGFLLAKCVVLDKFILFDSLIEKNTIFACFLDPFALAKESYRNNNINILINKLLDK
jgi:hypothetical protein